MHVLTMSFSCNHGGFPSDLPWMLVALPLDVPWVFVGSALGVLWVFLGCSLDPRWMFFGCSLGVRWIHVGCSLDVPWMCFGCSFWVRVGFPLGAPRVFSANVGSGVLMAPLTLQKRLGIPTADGIFWIDGRANARRRMGMHVLTMSFSCKK